MNLQQYFSVLLFILVSIVIGIGLLLVGYILSPKKYTEEKSSPYECGFENFGDARMQFDIRYYLVAILFILFDLEIAFLFPWAIVQDLIGMEGFIAVMLFLFILFVGFFYEWKKGAIDWE